jgi:hypothetical protein
MRYYLAIIAGLAILFGNVAAQAEKRLFIIANNPDAYGVDRCLATGASCGKGWGGQEERERDGEKGSNVDFHVELLIAAAGGVFFFSENDLLGIGGRSEDEGLIVVGRREVPGKDRYVLGTSVVCGGGQDEFPGKWMIPQLDPDLPVESGLPKGVMLAGDSANVAGPKVTGL